MMYPAQPKTHEEYARMTLQAGTNPCTARINPGPPAEEINEPLSYAKYERDARWALGQMVLNPDSHHWTIIAGAIEEAVERELAARESSSSD